MNCDECGLMFMKLSELKQHAACAKHKGKDTISFSCLPCSMPLHSVPDVIEHVDSAGHSIMFLAADNPFDTLIECGGGSESFPPLYFCMLCSCRDGNPYGIHLKSAIHKNIARLMRTIFQKRTIYYTNDSCDEHLFRKLKNPNGPVFCELCNSWSSNWYNYKKHLANKIHLKTQMFLNKLINVTQSSKRAHACEGFCYSFSFACGLCNIHFNSHESYMLHLENKTHKTVERFLAKISTLVRNVDVIIRSSDLNISETFSNSLPPLYYCEYCEQFSFDTSGYIKHSKEFIHKRITELFNKVSDKRKGDVIRLSVTNFHSTKNSKHCCKLCIVGFSIASDYTLHLNDKGHLKIERFINSLTNEEDINFINDYVDAQIRMMFGDPPHPNYCSLCNILLSNPENYKQHLATKEHEQAELNRMTNSDSTDENPSKRLKKSPLLSNKALDTVQNNSVKQSDSLKSPLLLSKALDTVQNNSVKSSLLSNKESDSVQNDSVINKSDSSTRELCESIEPLIGKCDEKTNCSISSWPGLVNREVNMHPPWFRLGAPVAGFRCQAPYGNYPPMLCFQSQELYGYYPSLPNCVTNTGYPPLFGINTNCPPWPRFQAHAYSNFGLNPLRPGFHSFAYATNSYSPPFNFNTHIQTTGVSIEKSTSSNIYPPGTEVLENNDCPPHDFETSCAQNGSEDPEVSILLSLDDHHCELCNYSCSNARFFEKHLKGDKHKKLMKLLNRKNKEVSSEIQISENAGHPLKYNCELCDARNTNAAQYETHLATAKHKKNQWLLYVLMQKPL